jgi:hypothetical protein
MILLALSELEKPHCGLTARRSQNGGIGWRLWHLTISVRSASLQLVDAGRLLMPFWAFSRSSVPNYAIIARLDREIQ